MSERINGKTHDEIKKGLRHCSEDGCKGCPYEDDCHLSDGGSELARDVLILIQREAREKAALLEDLKQADMIGCEHCANNKPVESSACEDAECDCERCKSECKCKDCIDNSNWEWRGVQEASNAEET